MAEPESAALASAVADATLVASDLVRTELRRVVLRSEPSLMPECEAVLARLRLVLLRPELLDAAGRLGPPGLRTLDAIHLECALLLGDELDAFVTYDARQAGAGHSPSPSAHKIR